MNIYDIAAGAGTSISTVSRVLNNKGDMNPKIRNRMEAALKKYDYKPSTIARDMVSRAMKNVAILTVNMRVTHYAGMIHVVEQEFSDLRYNVSVRGTNGSIQECDQYFGILSEKQTNGIVFIGFVLNELIKYLGITAKIEDTPIVIANGQVKLPNFYSVLVGDTKAIRMTSDYVSDHGRMDLFYVFDIATDSGRAKRQSFLETVKLRDVLDGNDRVPEDIAITGCDNSPDSKIREPELTTLDDEPELLSGVRASLLRDRMEGKESATGMVIQPELVVRGSESF